MSLLTNKKVLLLGGLTLAIGIGVAIHATSAPARTSQAQTLNLYESTNLISLDASKITDSVSSAQLSQVGEGLYRLNADSQPQNALATHTAVTNQGTTYTINLRHDGKWSNGQPVTASDFVYSWERTLDPKTKSEFTYLFANIQNAKAIVAGQKQPRTLGVQATGKFQLQINLTKPVPYFKKLLAGTTFYPLNETAVKEYGKRYGTSAQTTVYNGPFKLVGWNGTNNNWQLTKNPAYWGKKAVKLHQINYQVIKSESTAYNLYQSNQLDMVTLSGQANLQNQHNPNLKTLPTGRIGFIQYNQKDKLAANQNLRTAISLAINRQQLVHNVLQDGSVAASTFGVHQMLKNPKSGQDFVADTKISQTASYNLSAAQARFKQAQRELGHHQLTLTITCGDDETSQKLATFIQGQLTSHLSGLRVTIRPMPFTAMLTKVSQGNFQLNLTSWGMDFADPSQALTILTSDSNSNMGHYSSQTYDADMAKADGSDANNAPARYQDLITAEKTALKDQAVTPLYEGGSHILVKPTVHGVVSNKFNGNLDFRTAYMK
ncbi:peptide ABC transporter substrate-binding protein [Levilactobacillus bambusae]|uniref:Peptide ABC transporter substrate-binding protein n=1 Tax=Levilactobacillus bambusae TaxID=2024736 RepID=A0A2V1N115_9LACO|nr:peptide ABC transporter substrate-binding protein [Levilactobacillus bambusae]PWG00438.1 peptide ABC transporter substrate-binding protein [Levilactobacillus bambusae]